MEPDEAVQAAVEEFEIQKVDLTGINKTFYANRAVHPVVIVLKRLGGEVSALTASATGDAAALRTVLTNLRSLATDNSNGEDFVAEALSLAGQKGAVGTLLTALPLLDKDEATQLECLQTLGALLVTDPHRESFHKNGGTAAMVGILKNAPAGGVVAATTFATAAQACFKNEDNKASFIANGGDDALLRTFREAGDDTPTLIAACTALRSVTVADDDRPCLTSGAFKTAREICNKGAASELIKVLRGAVEGCAALATAACSALRRISVTDDICKEIADQQGVELLLQLCENYVDSPSVTRTSLSVLRQLANSDANKNLIIRRGGLRALQRVSVGAVAGSCEQALGLIVGLTLRNPDGANAAVEAGCIDTIADVMAALPGEQWVQRQGCMAVRNLVSRTPEHMTAFLAKGIEPLLRTAQTEHPMACKDVGGAALRDLGFEDYDLGLDPNED